MNKKHRKRAREAEVLSEFKERLVGKISSNLVSLTLFGSYARNEKNVGDIDVLLILKEPLGSPHETNKRIAEISGPVFGKYGLPISCLTYSLDQFKALREHLPIFEEIKNDGVTIYGEDLFSGKTA